MAFRIDDPSAAVALPTPEAAGTEGYFTEGNPGSGVPATLMRASFLNMLQEEVRNVVTAAGLTPSKTTYTQLRDAILALSLGQFSQTLASPGHVTLPNGFILNWGTATLSAGVATVSFQLAFPTICYGVISGTPNQTQTTTSTSVSPSSVSFASSGSTGTFYWFAWGK
jgi:hypothetical protein